MRHMMILKKKTVYKKKTSENGTSDYIDAILRILFFGFLFCLFFSFKKNSMNWEEIPFLQS